jgi:hypothetical protein
VDLTEAVHRLEAYIALLHTFVDNVNSQTYTSWSYMWLPPTPKSTSDFA